MRYLLFTTVVFFSSLRAEINPEIIDSLAFETAVNLKLNPFQIFSISIDNRDIISDVDISKISEQLLQALSIYCKKIERDDNSNLLMTWHLMPDIKNTNSFYINISISKNYEMLFKSKNYKVKIDRSLNSEEIERAIFTNHLINNLEKLKSDDLLDDYNLKALKSLVPRYEFEIFNKIAKIKYPFIFNDFSKNIILLNNYGDIEIPLKTDKITISKLFTINSRELINKAFVYTLKENDLTLKSNSDYLKILEEDIFSRNQILFPDNKRSYLWGSKNDFISFYNYNGICKLDFKETTLAYINDIVDNRKIWKISSAIIECRSINNNLVSYYKFFTFRDFIKIENGNFYKGDICFYFKNYFNNENLTFDNILEYMNEDFQKNLMNRVSGIHWRVKELMYQIIVEYVLSKREKYVTMEF